jgi:hypothetical protein
MTLRDRRSYRVALVADRYLNPPKGKLDAVPILLDAEWGAIQLPADEYPSAVAAPLLEQVAEQVEEFHRRGYDSVVIGRRDGLDEALKAVGVPHLDHIEPASARALRTFLSRRPAPAARSMRSRVSASKRTSRREHN